jgi:hypothetical protein
MAHELLIDPATGALELTGLARLGAGSRKAEAEAALAPLAKGERDFGNGYSWLYAAGLALGGAPASLGLCYFEGRLTMATWSVDLPDAPAEGGWPTREAIDAEVDFVLGELRRQLGRGFARDEESFAWGWAYSSYDPRGDTASSGLRYR